VSEVGDADGLFRAIVEQSLGLAVVLDADGRIAYMSPACGILLNDQLGTIVGVPFASCVHPDDARAVALLMESYPGEFLRLGRIRVRRPGEGWALLDMTARNCVHEAHVRGFILHGRDCADHDEIERRVRQATQRDSLTRLPTRNAFVEYLEQAIVENPHVAIFSIDVDGIGRVNDYDGRHAGDHVLTTIAARLAAWGDSFAARVGGNQFMVLATGIAADDAVYAFAARIAGAVAEKIAVGDQTFSLEATIGIARSPRHGDTAELLVASAEVALANARQRSHGAVLMFDEAMRLRVAERRATERELRSALANDAFHLVYQPVLRLAGGELTAFEALIRLPAYRHGTEHLIRAAEESLLIVPIDDHVLDLAVAEAAAWHRAGRGVRLSVNISPEHIRRGVLAESVERVLARHELPADRLEIEITEHVVLKHTDVALHTLGRLRALGVTIAIDDFGTGYSSLSYLRAFPVDKLKIDRSFVAGLGKNARDAALVDAMISVAEKLGIAVVAEGIETAEQADILRTLGCEYGQGYFFGRPVRSAEIAWPALGAKR
jgi:diguanylate cyclase (GGDEF)-like protein